MLDIYLHYTELPVEHVETLDELNSDHNLVLLAFHSLMSARLLGNACHFVI